jgi:bifunctional aspartokinase / homoserine dehydrogenase 1
VRSGIHREDDALNTTALRERAGLNLGCHNSSVDLSAAVVNRAGTKQDAMFHSALERRRVDRSRKRPLRVMKFGGTSVGNVPCIGRVVDIIRAATRDSNIVVVVSAMSGVTDRLIEVAALSESGDRQRVAVILEELSNEHEAVASALIPSTAERSHVSCKMQEILREGDHLCQGTILLRELTQRARDSISSLGERLLAPLVAATLADRGVASEAIDATELIVTDSFHGATEPLMEITRERCEARLRPLLDKGIVPVVTGYIGATSEGVLTTLGRGGSDYSATILGAALAANEIIIWTDVDGVLTADPRLVPDARTIPEISYREAAELAYFGAKVLHPKTLRAVMRARIPVWIRNSFEPERIGTKITPQGRSNGGGVKALTAVKDVTLITVGGPGIVGVPDVVGRTFSTTSKARANVLLISQSSSQNDICFIVASSDAKRTVEALRSEFVQDVAHEKVEHITVEPNIAVVAVVGEKMHGTPGVAGRTFSALGREGVNIIAIAQGSSECNISFVVEEQHMKAALAALHQEFALAAPAAPELSVSRC